MKSKHRVIFGLCVLRLIGYGLSCAAPNQNTPTTNMTGPIKFFSLTPVSINSFVAEVRITYMGKDGRLKGTASLAVKRPDRMRYELMGPHGGVLSALAVKNGQFELFDLKTSRFFVGPASPEILDQLLGIAPLRLQPEAWVALLFGEVLLPDKMRMQAQSTEQGLVVRWHVDNTVRQILLDPATGWVKEATSSEGEQRIYQIEFMERDQRGLPMAVHLKVFQDGSEAELRLRDVNDAVNLNDEAFTLPRPEKMVIETWMPN
jgi:hypothetical protein